MSTLSDNLRAMADFMEQHPDLRQPYITTLSSGKLNVSWYLTLSHNVGDDLAAQKREAVAIVKALGGQWDKQPSNIDSSFNFRQRRDWAEFTVQVEREAVCERIVIGTKTVTVPAKPAEAERTVEVEDVEWRCEPLLSEVAS